jgi:signal transduction histidine kinase
MFARAMRQRRLSPTMLRLVAAVFVLQLLSSAAAIFFLRTQMLDVVRADREDQVIDVRDDLLAAFYSGGRRAGRFHPRPARQRGRSRRLRHAGRWWRADLDQQHRFRPGDHAWPAPAAGAGAAGRQRHRAGCTGPGQHAARRARLTVGLMGASERRFNLAFAAAIGLTIAVAVALALVSALVLGLAISSRTHEIAKAAEELAAGNFGMRLAEGQSGDGFDHLRLQMNQMAERIASLVAELGAVSGALAHDLRSPVTRLSAAIDTALARVDEPGAVEALQAARADADGLRAMLETALEISRLEGARCRIAVSSSIWRRWRRTWSSYEPLAEQSGVTLALDLSPPGSWPIAN